MVMFAVYCEGHGAGVVLDRRFIDAVTNSLHGIEVHFRCTCGHRGVWHVGGEREQRLA